MVTRHRLLLVVYAILGVGISVAALWLLVSLLLVAQAHGQIAPEPTTVPAASREELLPERGWCNREDCGLNECSTDCGRTVRKTFYCEDSRRKLMRDEEGRHWCVLPAKEK